MNKKVKGRQKNLFKRKLKIMRDLEMKNLNLKQISCIANYNLLGKLKSGVQLLVLKQNGEQREKSVQDIFVIWKKDIQKRLFQN